jgi:hypothetical protein
MGRITLEVLGRAVLAVERMNPTQKVQLADEIFALQPNLLAAILVLPRMGVSALQLEVPLHILLVSFQAMKGSGHVWPRISEELQEQCLQRLMARMRFNGGLPAHLADQVVTQFHEEHPERELLAFIYGQLGEHDLLGARTEAEKYLMLAALNLAECIAAAAAKTGAR